MLFGLSNALNTFMWVKNQFLRSFIGKLVIVYFHDILIHNTSQELHLQYLRKVLSTLKTMTLCTAVDKYIFLIEKVLFLGYGYIYWSIESGCYLRLATTIYFIYCQKVSIGWNLFTSDISTIMALIPNCMKQDNSLRQK